MKRLVLISAIPVILILALVFVAGCRTVPVQHDFVTPFTNVTEAFADTPTIEPHSSTEAEAILRVKNLLGNFTPENIRGMTEQVYAPDAYLNDTLKTVRGASEIRDYFAEAAELTDQVKVDFTDVTRGNDGVYYFRWTMDIRMKKLARGETVRTIGVSLIRFDSEGRIQWHQDCWDSTSGLFQHVPGIGRGIRAVKARL